MGILSDLIASASPYGLVAGLGMFLIVPTSFRFVRNRNYELFYVAHVILVALILVTGRHDT